MRGGGFISFGDFYQRRASLQELRKILRPLSLLETQLWISRMNFLVRHALDIRQDRLLSETQHKLLGAFLDDETRRRLQDRFEKASALTHPIFHPHQLLNLLRFSFTSCQGPPQAEFDFGVQTRYKLGTACLILNDLLLSPREEQLIAHGTSDKRRRQLMTQLIGPFELLNTPDPRRLILRCDILIKDLLQDKSVVDDIKRRSKGFDISKEFERATGLPLQSWFHQIMAMYLHFMGFAGRALEDPSMLIIERDSFIAQTKILPSDFELFLKTVSCTTADYKSELAKRRPLDMRHDFAPFRSAPLLEFMPHRYTCVDLGLLAERMHVGIFWILRDRLPADQRKKLLTAWGLLFEHYNSWLLKGLAGKNDIIPVARPELKKGREACDFFLLQLSRAAFVEAKGGFLTLSAKYSQQVRKLTQELDRKFVQGQGLTQIFGTLDRCFGLGSKATSVAGIPLCAITEVLPILVVQEPAMQSVFLNWWLNRRFQRLLRKLRTRPGLKIQPLTVIHIDELEAMVESAESGSFDFLYFLWLRAIRSPDMLWELQDFLATNAAGFGMHNAERFDRVLKRYHSDLFQYTFGHGSLS